MQQIGRDDVTHLVADRQAVLVEVLARPEYDWAHLPGAEHLPLKGWELDQVHAVLDPGRPVVAYCNDFQ